MLRALPFPRSQAAAPSERLGAIVHAAGPEALARLGSEHAVATPFQTAGWISAFLEAHAMLEDFRLVELRDSTGNALLLPLVLHRQVGAVLAGKIGGAHASYFLPVTVGEIAGWDTGAIRNALKQAAAEAGIDALLLADSPLVWAGKPNPLAFLTQHPAPGNGAMLTLQPDVEALLNRLSDRDARKKLRQKAGKLAATGVLEFGWVREPEAALALYYRWKAAQFASQGIPDAFAAPEIRQFLHLATTGATPAIHLYALTAGGRMLAILGGALSGEADSNRHFSGMFTAYDPEFSRLSPGEILVSELVRQLASEGVQRLDLGVGEARYKAHYCPELIALVDLALPVTGYGRIASVFWFAARGLKRLVKHNATLLGLLKRFRKRLAA